MFGRPPPPPPSSSSSSSLKKKKFIHVRNIDGISIFVETSSGMPVWVLPAGVDIQKDIQYICILNDDRTHYFKDFNTNAISHDLPEQDMSGNARSVCYALLAYNNDQCTSFMENPYNAAASKAQDDSLNMIIKKLYSSNSIKTDSKTPIDNNEEDAYYFDNKNDKDDDNNRSSISETNRESNIYMRQSEVGNEIFIEGYLMKLARSSERNWKKRYFILSRTAISYYSKGRPLTKSLGDLIITGDTTIKEHDEELHGYAFRISNQYGTIKMAGSKEEVTEWIDKIASLIVMNKKMCCDYLQKRSYRLGFTSNVKKFFVLTEDKITVHPSAEKATYVEAMIRINDSAQITYDDKSYRMTFIDSNPNASKNELTIQFPDSGLEFGAWRSFILKNITIDEVNFKLGTSNSMPPPPPPPPLVQTSSNASRTSMKKDTLISPIAKVPTTPTASDDNDSFNTFDATSSTTGMNALQAAKARREARNSETKQQPPPPSRPFMSKLTASIPFYGANQSEPVKRTSTQSVEPAVFGVNPLSDTNDDDDDDDDEKANVTNNETMNDSTQADDVSMEIDINLSDNNNNNNNNSKPTTTSRNSTDSSSRFSFRSARKMFEKKNVSFDNKNLAKSKDDDAYEAKAYPEEKNYDTNSSSVNGIKVSKYAIKLADLNTSTSLLSSPQELNTSLASPPSASSSSSSSPLPPPPTSPYLSLLQTDIIDINPNTNLMRSFDHAKDTPSMTNSNASRTSVSESVTNPTYKRNTKSESYTNTMRNTYSSNNEQSSMHSIENFVASISSSREDMIRQFHNNVQQINVFVKEPKENKELRTKIQKDSKYCQTDQRIYMDDIHRRPYEILVAEKEELIIAREKLALDVTTALAHIKKEEEASLKKIKEFDVQMKQKYDDIAAQLDAKKVKQEEDHKQLVESFELTRKAADHLHKKRLVELQVVARSMAKHHDKIIKERQLIAVQRFQLFLSLQDLNSTEKRVFTSKFPILKEEVPRVYHPRTLSPTERAEALLVTYGTKAKNVNAKNKVLNNNNKKKIGRSFVYGGREGPYVPDLNV